VDIADVKKEFSSDEKLLESAFKLETLYKKYKLIIWGVAGVLFLSFAGSKAMDAMHQATLEEANSAFLQLQQNPKDSSALATLKAKNPALFELFSYAQAIENKDVAALKTLANSSNSVVSDSSQYGAAVLENHVVDSTLYKEMAWVEEAYVALKAGKKEEAKAKLEMIESRSPLASVATLLKHATMKVEK
jgi:hypothetical protein